MSWARRWLARLSLLAGSTLFALFVVEFALRMLGYPSRVLEFSPSGVPGYSLMAPHQDYIERGWHPHQPPYRVRINSMGLRGEEVVADRAWTILALGDSFTFGAGVEVEDTFAYQLRGLLRRRFGPSVEVVNAGHAGATIDHELVVFEQRGVPLRPDVVILQFFTNDIEDLLDRERLEGVYRQVDFPLKAYLRHTAIYLLLLRLKLSGMRWLVAVADRTGEPANLPFRHDTYYNPDPSPRLRHGWELYLTYLEKLLSETRRRGIALVILAIPDQHQVARPRLYPMPQKFLGDFARRHSVPFVDSLAAFRWRMAAGEQLYLPRDGHLNARGHALVAELLSVALIEHGLGNTPRDRIATENMPRAR